MTAPQAATAAIAERLAKIRASIDSACTRDGRAPESVTLLLATKTVPAERLALAADCGATLFGENRLQEALPKHARFREIAPATAPRVEWHFIGHLQTNKIKQVLRFADCVQSVDRLRLVEQLEARLAREQRQLQVFVQVNTSGEASKYGVAPEDAEDLVRAVAAAPHLSLCGLMTIGRLGASPEDARPGFRQLRVLRDHLRATAVLAPDQGALSMGMSADYEVAIEEGATLVRVGSAVFGERGTPDTAYWPESVAPPSET